MIGSWTRAGVALLFVFASGVFAGIFFDRHHWVHTPAGVSAADVHEAAMSQLREVLGLDDRQVEQINAIMAEHQQVVQHAWETLRPEVQSAMRGVHAEIAEVLRPEQRELFHDWLIRYGEQNEAQVMVIPRHN